MEFSISRKSSGGHVIVKNFVQFSSAIISYWLIGYAFSFGSSDSTFIGEEYFGGDEWIEDKQFRCNSYSSLVGVFVIFIINGAMTERISYISSIVFSIFLMIFVWPVIVSWMWGDGWLTSEMDESVQDQGGSITVFTFAGAFGLVGAVLTGRRPGRWESGSVEVSGANKGINSYEMYLIGSMLTILGCFGIGFAQWQGKYYGFALGNMWICAAVSSLLSLKILTFFDDSLFRHYLSVYQGFIAGIVCIASAAGNTTPWQAGLHGLLAGIGFVAAVKLVEWLKIDDPLNVVATFLVPGICGGILPGFIDDRRGAYWSGWESCQFLGTQTVATSVTFFWAIFWAVITFGLLWLVNLLNIDKNLRIIGLSKTVITQKGYSFKRWINLEEFI
jgi:Amt family ammonium transporter